MDMFTSPRRIEDVTPDEWDFGVGGAVDSLLMEGLNPFDHPDKLEERVLTILAESEFDAYEDGDIDYVEMFGEFDDDSLWLDS